MAKSTKPNDYLVGVVVVVGRIFDASVVFVAGQMAELISFFDHIYVSLSVMFGRKTHTHSQQIEMSEKLHANNLVWFVFCFFFLLSPMPVMSRRITTKMWIGKGGERTKKMRREKRKTDECTEWPNIRHNTFALVLCLTLDFFFIRLHFYLVLRFNFQVDKNVDQLNMNRTGN